MLVRVKVQARAKDDKIIPQAKDKLLIQTREPAREGRANQKIRLLLADYFRVSPKQVRILRGRNQPHKLYQIYTHDRSDHQ